MAEESDAAWGALLPKTKADLAKYKESIRPVLGVLLDHGLPAEDEIITDDVSTKDVNDLKVLTARIGRKSEGNPAADRVGLSRRPVRWPSGDLDRRSRKVGSVRGQRQPTPAVRKLVMAGFAVTSVDQFLTGEFLNEGESPVYKVEEGFPAYTYCYNRPLLAHRVRDVLTLIRTSKLHPM